MLNPKYDCGCTVDLKTLEPTRLCPQAEQLKSGYEAEQRAFIELGAAESEAQFTSAGKAWFAHFREPEKTYSELISSENGDKGSYAVRIGGRRDDCGSWQDWEVVELMPDLHHRLVAVFYADEHAGKKWNEVFDEQEQRAVALARELNLAARVHTDSDFMKELENVA